jgi:hypothetical protein
MDREQRRDDEWVAEQVGRLMERATLAALSAARNGEPVEPYQRRVVIFQPMREDIVDLGVAHGWKSARFSADAWLFGPKEEPKLIQSTQLLPNEIINDELVRYTRDQVVSRLFDELGKLIYGDPLKKET